jgi:hypothetical protein
VFDFADHTDHTPPRQPAQRIIRREGIFRIAIKGLILATSEKPILDAARKGCARNQEVILFGLVTLVGQPAREACGLSRSRHSPGSWDLDT